MSHYLSERVAYLKGLSDGLEIKAQEPEGKLLLKMVEVLQEIADAVDGLQETVDELDEYAESIDEDLEAVEKAFYGEEDKEEEEDFLEIECPHCHETVYFDEDMLADETLICPACQTPVFEPEEEEPSEELEE